MILKVEITNRQILKIALPITASILVPQVNFIINNIFLGHLGEQPLAVAGITGVYYLIFGVMGFGLSNGLQALMARRAGENRPEEIGKLFAHALRIAIFFALAGIVTTYFIAPKLFSVTLHNPDHIDLAVNYLHIRIVGIMFLYLYQMQNAVLISTNQSKLLIIGTIIETLANIILDYGLIFGNLGLPMLGFNGAAVASVTAEFIGMITVFGVIHYKRISQKLALFKDFAHNARYTRLILNQSSPLILQLGLSVATWEFFYILIEHHGERALAISNIMRNIFGLFGCVTWAFASTTNSMVSNIIGQGLDHRVMELIRKIIILSLSFSIVISILLNISPGFLLKAYGQDDQFIAAAIPVIRIISIALLMQSISTVFLNAVVGTGNSRMNLLTELFTITIYIIYVYITLEHLYLSIEWGWVSEWLYWICLFIPSYWYMRSGRWKGKII